MKYVMKPVEGPPLTLELEVDKNVETQPPMAIKVDGRHENTGTTGAGSRQRLTNKKKWALIMKWRQARAKNPDLLQCTFARDESIDEGYLFAERERERERRFHFNLYKQTCACVRCVLEDVE
jgi:hypothetical protein